MASSSFSEFQVQTSATSISRRNFIAVLGISAVGTAIGLVTAKHSNREQNLTAFNTDHTNPYEAFELTTDCDRSILTRVLISELSLRRTSITDPWATYNALNSKDQARIQLAYSTIVIKENKAWDEQNIGPRREAEKQNEVSAEIVGGVVGLGVSLFVGPPLANFMSVLSEGLIGRLRYYNHLKTGM